MDGGREEERREPVIGPPCSDECFISVTVLLVGYLPSPSCRLVLEPEGPAGFWR